MLKLSCDDGCASDVKVADLCNKYELQCIFYIPVEWHSLAHDMGYKPLEFSELEEINNTFEIGSHSITHRHLTKIPEDEAIYEIEESGHILSHMISKEVKSFAPPRGYLNPHLTKHAEAIYDNIRLTRGKNLVHVHPNSGANDNQDWKILAIQKMNDGDIELWLHSWEIDKFNMWDELDEFISIHSKV